ncbi:AraC family transcriptional regulator [Georgenia faecalis]|uniref:AraC family transcriptional regulator n=1 Tax=Georgenia faecalis TaxID=2483799 RepID=A0ABV9DBV2_9MICO|nr:AraC family transcriptional regulator [Georgenia faecalis]
MDPVVALVDGPRARGAFVLRSVMDPPWSLRVEDRAPLTVVTMVRGHAHVLPDSAAPVHLGPGDVVVLQGPDGYTLADDPATAPQAVIHPGQRCTSVDGTALVDIAGLGVRTWGNAADGATVMVTGTYQRPHEVGRHLLGALPPVLTLRGEEWDEPLVALIARESIHDRPGQEAVLDRLLDLLLVAALRAWFDGPGAQRPGWYGATADPVVGHALRLLQDSPARPWTVAHLAAATGVSRATLARRFTELVGEPPMSFLTTWRLNLAADLLLDPDATLAAVARQVGYSTPFALSAAFKRHRGVSPQEHRTTKAPPD